MSSSDEQIMRQSDVHHQRQLSHTASLSGYLTVQQTDMNASAKGETRNAKKSFISRPAGRSLKQSRKPLNDKLVHNLL